jgi:organic hydroperoxide reductase OsmC/OhrA
VRPGGALLRDTSPERLWLSGIAACYRLCVREGRGKKSVLIVNNGEPWRQGGAEGKGADC